MLNQHITVPPGSNKEIQDLVIQFNQRLDDIHLNIAQGQGTDGLVPKISSDLDLQNKQIINSGIPFGLDSPLSGRSVRSKAFYRSKRLSRQPISKIIAKDIEITEAVGVNQPVAYSQLRAAVSESIASSSWPYYADATQPTITFVGQPGSSGVLDSYTWSYYQTTTLGSRIKVNGRALIVFSTLPDIEGDALRFDAPAYGLSGKWQYGSGVYGNYPLIISAIYSTSPYIYLQVPVAWWTTTAYLNFTIDYETYHV